MSYFLKYYFLCCNLSIHVGSQPIISISWLPTLRLLATLTKDGSLQVWKTQPAQNPNRPPTQAGFFEQAGMNLQTYLCFCDSATVCLVSLCYFRSAFFVCLNFLFCKRCCLFLFPFRCYYECIPCLYICCYLAHMCGYLAGFDETRD